MRPCKPKQNQYLDDLTISVSHLHNDVADLSHVFSKIVSQVEKQKNVTHDLIEALRVALRKYPALCLDPAIISALNSYANLHEGDEWTKFS